MDKSIKWYLAGPMTGYPQFNIPLFDQVTALLRADGYTIVSPAERDTYETRLAALESQTGDHTDMTFKSETYGDMLARDMKILADEVDGIILLPGWAESNGAKTEAYIGLMTGCVFGYYGHGKVTSYNQNQVAGVVASALTNKFQRT